jgi:DNA repair exonuclease SbcCD ATPase subunit
MNFLRTLVAMPLMLCVLVSGCGDGAKARVEVAKDAAAKKLDELLGSMTVKRKEIDLNLQGLNKAVVGLKKAKLKAQAKAEELSRKAEPSETRLREVDATLARYRDLLGKNEPVTLGGKTYSPEELKNNADKLIQGRKATAAAVGTFQKSKNELQKVVNSLTDKQRSMESRIDAMKMTLSQIDSQMVAVRAIQDAKSSAGDADVPIDETVTAIEDKIGDLLTDVTTTVGEESDSFDEASTDNELDAIDAIVDESSTAADTVADIDKLIGDSK